MIDRNALRFLKEAFPKGTRVRLLKMEDLQAPPIGTLGTVSCVDDIGTIHINWDNGSGLGAAFGEDVVITVSPKRANA